MLTFRPTQILAKRLHLDWSANELPPENPFTDWCAHGFIAGRHRYVILTNTHSLFSAVTSAAGLTSEAAFVRRAVDTIQEVLAASGRKFVWQQHISPATKAVRFARFSDRRVMGSMNDLIYAAKIHLVERGASPLEVSARLNCTPMSLLWNRGPSSSPDLAIDEMTRNLSAQ